MLHGAEFEALRTGVRILIWLGMLVSAWFYGASVWGARRFFRERREENEPRESWLPPATVLKPLKGLDRELYENLDSFCRQDYPRFQLVCAVADAKDPAATVVRRLQAEHPGMDIELVVDSRTYGTNYKVSNLINAYRRAKHDVLVIADSDIRVGPGYLRRIVAPLRGQSIGLVSCLYRAVPAGDFWSLIEALFVNTDFCHQVLVARMVERPTYAFGASMALRRSTLEAVGGFPLLARMLADDYYLGHRIAERGWDLWLSDEMVETVLPRGSWKRAYRHQLRWARTFRSVRPGGYFGTVLTHGTWWGLANLLFAGWEPSAIVLTAVLWGLRVATAAWISWRFLGTRLRAAALAVLLVKDLFVSAIWLASFFGNTVWWSGRQFRILKWGEMELCGEEPEVRATEAIPSRAR